MNIDLELQKQKIKYADIYSEISLALNYIEGFNKDTNVKERFYYEVSNILKDYLDRVEDLSIEANKKVSFFERYKQRSIIDEKYNDLMEFKEKNLKHLEKLTNCSKCRCLKCLEICRFNSCARCMGDGHVKYCNKKDENLIKFENLVEQQYNYETSQNENIDILAEIVADNKRYRIIFDREENVKLNLTYDYSQENEHIYEIISSDEKRIHKIIELFEENKL